jgi:hypothetical protein
LAERTADVFFIHPTTYLATAISNARYDEPGATRTRLEQGVLRFQASAFNGCCRIYAPRYRQAALGSFLKAKDAAATAAAYELAYRDVERAFDYYISQENHGRPFLLASHSQGSLHAMRLLQERIAGRALQKQLIAAYIVGYALPSDIARAGVPVCGTAPATGCLVDWNSTAAGTNEETRRTSRLIWLDGHYQPFATRQPVCVNPLNWVPDSAAPAALNLGALPGVPPGQPLRAPVPQLTGARCDGGLLTISLPWSERGGFTNLLTAFGSYHVFDYNLFYLNIRANAVERLAAYRAAGPEVP